MDRWNHGKGTRRFLSDAHAHLGSEPEREERLQNPIPTLVSAGNPQEAEKLRELLKKPEARGILIPTYGLHPWHADLEALEAMIPFLELGGIIGEIGMDSVWCDVPLALQREVFTYQLEFAEKQRKPVVLHTKGQESEIAQIIGGYPNTYLVHWYSAKESLEEYLEKDCYFSIGPDVWWNPAVQRVAELVPDNRILIETDGMGAVRWAYEEAGNLIPAEASRPVPATVTQALYNTLGCVAKIRKKGIDQMAEQVEGNFNRFSHMGDCE